MTTSYLTSIRRHLAPLALTACLLSVGMISVPSAATADETASVGTIATGAFHHPGVLVNRAQLDFVKSKVAEGAEPWKSAFEAAKASDLGALDYTPKPRDEVCCGPRSNPNLGCKDEQRDSEAAYTQALLWYFSGNRTYAANAIKIMNAWSGTLTGGHKLANAEIQAAWCGEVWPRAAEIIRYTDAGWSTAERRQVSKHADQAIRADASPRLVRERQQGIVHERSAHQHRRLQRRPHHL